MESKQPDSNIKAILNSPARYTPAVPKPDWNSLTPQPQQTSTTSQSAVIKPIPNAVVPSTSASIAGDTNITIHNCVSASNLNAQLDLSVINARTRNSEYNPSRFTGLVMRLREPATTALIFSTGRFICTGAKSEYDSLLASKKVARIIQKIGFNIKFDNFRVVNIVATCDLRFPIKLENLSLMHGQFCSYEPELFPGLIYRMIKPRICVLIFVNGKLVFTGAKARQEIKEALDNIFPILRSFRKN